MSKDLTPLENFMDLVNYLAKRVKIPRMSGKTILEDAETQKTIKQIKIVEKSLKALDIIKEKGVNIRLLKETDNVKEYNELIKSHYGMFRLLSKEYKILKEVLK